MGILPTRPLRLDPGHLAKLTRKSWLLAAMAAALAGGFSTGAWFWTRAVLDERQLWSTGLEGELRDVSGTVHESRKLGVTFFYEYRLAVEYADRSGAVHRGDTEFDLIWWPVQGELQRARVRYDPADPERFALSASAEAGFARWGFPAVMGGFALLFWVGLVVVRKQHRDRLRWFELVAVDGEEVLAPLHGVVKDRATYRVTFSWPGSKAKLQEELTAPPLVIEVEKVPHVVALRSPRDAKSHVVVQTDLAPFAFDPGEKTAILERAATGD